MESTSHKDPFFAVPKPVIFAHRGGAAEAPESTIEAFLHGLRHRAHVLEFDVQLTKDGVPVVWHGPGLDNTFNEEGEYQKGVRIGDWDWEKIAAELWVAHPKPKNDKEKELKCPHRRIISLTQLIDFINEIKQGDNDKVSQDRPIHLNLELKKRSAPHQVGPKRKIKNGLVLTHTYNPFCKSLSKNQKAPRSSSAVPAKKS